MLMQHDYSGLADRFGYALAHDRATAAAIEADFLNAVASPYIVASDARKSVVVKYFAPNDPGLFALVECMVPVADGAAVLLQLVVAGNADERHITVEDVSGVAA